MTASEVIAERVKVSSAKGKRHWTHLCTSQQWSWRGVGRKGTEMEVLSLQGHRLPLAGPGACSLAPSSLCPLFSVATHPVPKGNMAGPFSILSQPKRSATSKRYAQSPVGAERGTEATSPRRPCSLKGWAEAGKLQKGLGHSERWRHRWEGKGVHDNHRLGNC